MSVSRNIVPPFAFSTTHILHGFTYFELQVLKLKYVLLQKHHGNVQLTAYNYRMEVISILTARSTICTKQFTKDQDGTKVLVGARGRLHSPS